MENVNNLMPNPRASSFLYPISKKSYLLFGRSNRNKAYNNIWLLLPNEKKWESIFDNNPISKLFSSRSSFSYVITEKNNDFLTIYIYGGLDFFQKNFNKILVKEITIVCF